MSLIVVAKTKVKESKIVDKENMTVCICSSNTMIRMIPTTTQKMIWDNDCMTSANPSRSRNCRDNVCLASAKPIIRLSNALYVKCNDCRWDSNSDCASKSTSPTVRVSSVIVIVDSLPSWTVA